MNWNAVGTGGGKDRKREKIVALVDGVCARWGGRYRAELQGEYGLKMILIDTAQNTIALSKSVRGFLESYGMAEEFDKITMVEGFDVRAFIAPMKSERG